MHSRRFVAPLAGLLFALPSLGLVQKYAGLSGCLVYTLATVALVSIGSRGDVIQRLRASRFTVAVVAVLALGLVASAVGFDLFFPEWDARVDRDEAIEFATARLLRGEYPYAVTTQLGNPITPMPGELLLAAPFVLAGSVSFANFAWWPLALVWLARRFGAVASLQFAVACLACPAFLQEWAFGGDLVWSLLAWVLLSVEVLQGGPRVWASASLLGLALASRPHLALGVLPLWLAAVRVPDVRARRGVLLACAVAAAVTLPFLLPDPSAFAPLHVRGKLDVPGVPRLATQLLVAVAAVVGAAVAWRSGGDPAKGWLDASVVSQAVVVVGLVAAWSFAAGGLDFAFLKERHALVVFFPAVVGWLYVIHRPSPTA